MTPALAPAPVQTEPHANLRPYDYVRLWKVIRFEPDGARVLDLGESEIGQLGGRRIVATTAWGERVLRVVVGGRVEYVPFDAACWFDPDQTEPAL